MTLTLEPRDLLGVDGSAGGPPTKGGGAALGSATKDGRGAKTEEVELRRRPGEGFGFVIASQEVTNGSECLSAFVFFVCFLCWWRFRLVSPRGGGGSKKRVLEVIYHILTIECFLEHVKVAK